MGKTVETRKPARRGTADAFVAFALLQETDDCILWPFGKDANGYGKLRQKTTHRVICEAAHGPPFPKARACHSCGNPACINKRHIRWGTAKDNAKDAQKLGELATGERRKNTKLTDAQCFEIYAAGHSKSISQLAKEYGVSTKAIDEIRACRRACLRHIRQPNANHDEASLAA